MADGLANIPTLDGIDPGAIENAAAGIGKAGTGIRHTGEDVLSVWRRLAGVYHAPEDGKLFGAMKPVQADTDRFGWEVGQVGAALSEFASEIAPIKAKLQALKAEAGVMLAAQAATSGGESHWRRKQSNVDAENRLLHEAGTAFNAAREAAAKCANRINGLYGGVQYRGGVTVTDSPGDYWASDPSLVPSWGTPVERDRPWYEDAWHGGVGIARGIVVDGPVKLVEGLGGLIGYGDANHDGHGDWSLSNLGNTWKSLGLMGVPTEAPALLLIPQIRKDVLKTNVGGVKGLLSWDEWKKDKGRAAGQVVFNVLTLAIPETKLGLPGRAGDTTLAVTRGMNKLDVVGHGIDLGVRGVRAGVDALRDLHVGDDLTHMPKIRVTDLDHLPETPAPHVDPVHVEHPDVPPRHVDPVHVEHPDVPPRHVDPVHVEHPDTSAQHPPDEPLASAGAHRPHQPHTPSAGAAKEPPPPRPTVRQLVDHLGKKYEHSFDELDKKPGARPEHEPVTVGANHPVGAHAPSSGKASTHSDSGAKPEPLDRPGNGNATNPADGHSPRTSLSGGNGGSPSHDGSLLGAGGSDLTHGGGGSGHGGVVDHSNGHAGGDVDHQTVTHDSPLAPERDQPFGHDGGLRPHTSYDVTDASGRHRGIFVTDEHGNVAEVNTKSGKTGNWNPDLRHPLPNATYRVDGRYSYHTDGEARTVEAHGELTHTGSDRERRMMTDQRDVGWEGRDEYREINKRAVEDFYAEHGRLPAPHEVAIFEDVKWNGGHLIGTEHGGPGERLNMTPMLESLNQARKGSTHLDNYRRLEQLWSKLHKQHPDAKIDVSIYADFAPVRRAADTVSVRYWVDGRPQKVIEFDNIPPKK